MNILKKIALLSLIWYGSSAVILATETIKPYEHSHSPIGSRKLVLSESGGRKNHNIIKEKEIANKQPKEDPIEKRAIVDKEIERVKEYRQSLINIFQKCGESNFNDDPQIQEYNNRISELSKLLGDAHKYSQKEIEALIDDIQEKHHPEYDK